MGSQAFMDNLDFGKESAESERRFLEKVFLPTPLFERIKRGQKQLVLGRKGTGKTAFCLRILDDLETQDAKVSLITPRDLSRFKISLLERGTLNPAESSLLSWKYVFFVRLSLFILQEAKHKLGDNYFAWPNDVKKVRRFLVDNVAGQANWIDKIFKVVSHVRKIGLKIIEVQVELASTPREVADLTDTLDHLTDTVAAALAAVVPEAIYILVDKVDEMWESGEESESLVIGLLRASKEIRDELDSVNVIVFLRTDVYDSLRFHDSDKFHSLEERIVWNETDLKKLVALRARTSSGIGMRRDAYDRIWRYFFPERIEETDSFEYLLAYTLMRPRDLIHLCNLCRDKAQNRSHATITVDDIISALPEYSKWKLKDLRDEYQVQYPFLERVFLGLFQHAKPRMDRKRVERRFELIREDLLREYGGLYFDPLDNLLQILYNIGFLGAIKGDRVLYRHLGNNVVIPYIQQFEVHLAYRSALEIESRPEQPDAADPVVVDEIAIEAGAATATSAESVVGVIGDPVDLASRAESEVFRLLRYFRGQRAPGHLLNADEDMTLPQFHRVYADYVIPKTGIRLDILAEGESARWAIEVRYSRLRVEDVHILVTCGLLASARPWLVAFTAVSEDVRAIAKNLNVLLTGPEEWYELRKLIE